MVLNAGKSWFSMFKGALDQHICKNVSLNNYSIFNIISFTVKGC